MSRGGDTEYVENAAAVASNRFSDELESWLSSDADKTLGGLLDLLGQRAFALAFILLLGPSALPAPTGGVTNALEIIAMLLAVQLLANRDRVWLPQRWRDVEIADPAQERFLRALIRFVRRLERRSRPRLTFLFGGHLSNVAFGALVLAGTLGAFVAPPFSGLDTLPSLGVVLVSLGVVLEDAAVVVVGVAAGAAGIALELLFGRAALDAIGRLF